MPTSYTNLLGLALPVTGELSGTWGDEVNNYITQYLDASVAGTQTISGSQTAVTLSKTTNASLSQAGSGATGSSQYLIINCTGNPGGLLTITAPAASKPYIVINATSTSQSVKIVGAGPTTGVTIPSGQRALVAWNGSDFVQVGATPDVTLAGNNAFTGANTFYNATGQTFGTATAAQDGIILAGRSGGSSSFRVTLQPTTLTASRTVTLPNANTTIPIATQPITFSGPSAARTYTFPDANATVLTTNAAVTVAQGGTGATTLTGILKGNGTSAFTAATAGTDFVAPGTATTFTATQSFSGSSSAIAAVLTDAAEVVTVSATAATGTIAYDVTTQAVLFYTSNASANWTVNFRGSSGTSLNTLMSTGQSMTVAFLVTQGATPYYNTTVQVDGTTSGVTTRWQGGTAPTAGNASGVDVYSYTIIKTANATFSVFASQTRFA